MKLNRIGTTRRGRTDAQTCAASDLRVAISIYLIAECPNGASFGHLARLSLAGRAEAEEVEPVSEAVSELVGAGLVTIQDSIVVPVKLTS